MNLKRILMSLAIVLLLIAQTVLISHLVATEVVERSNSYGNGPCTYGVIDKYIQCKVTNYSPVLQNR